MHVFFKYLYFRHLAYQSVRSYTHSIKSNLFKVLESMPKEPKHIVEAQKQRRKIKEKLSKYVPGKVTLQVLGTGAKGAPRSLYLFSDQSRYLFNCGEGTQRLAHEHKMKLAKLEHIFITQPIWKNIGGLPGVSLTIQDVGVPEVTLHGPPGLDEIFVATRRFVVIRDLKINMAECSENNIFEDNVMSVKYVPLSRSVNLDKSKEVVEVSSSEDEQFKNSEVDATVDQVDATTSTRSENKRKRRRSSTRSLNITEELVEDNTDYYAHERKRKHNRSRLRSRSRSQSSDSGNRVGPSNISADSQQALQEIKERGISMAYICKLQPRPGALNLDKCVTFGVPPGPLLGKLKGGEDVVLKNGNVVSSKDVCEPDDPGPIFIVVDCPNMDYLDSLVNNKHFKEHQKHALHDDKIAKLVVHFTPKEIVEHPKYKEWINEFVPSTHHLMLNEGNICMGSQAVHKIQYKLNLLSEELFPLLGDKSTHIDESLDGHVSKKQKFESSLPESIESCPQNDINLENLSVGSRPTSPESYIYPNTFCNFHLRPNKGLDRSNELRINPKEYINETLAIDNLSNTLEELKQTLIQKRKNLIIGDYPNILFLGTGSCIPNKTRNTSGILLKTNPSQAILLDCGEGTYGQLMRFFGKNQADETLASIQGIYISHLHADHHLGLIGVLQGRRKALDKMKIENRPVYLFAPKQILAWLYFYNKCFESITREFVLIPNSDLLYNNYIYPDAARKVLLEQLGMNDIKTCLVRHCPNAFGVAFTDINGKKLTYSGDTMPTDTLIELGCYSDVLIHEATMEDELSHEAVIKMHSTTSQAIEVGKKMNAKSILLTHFSQRYAKLPRFNDNFAENVGIAFDYMQVRIDELPLVPYLYPALKLMFAEHCEELEHKAVKRQMRMERQRSASRENKLKQNQVVS